MKSNVTNIRPITGGLSSLVLTDDELIGWLIYRSDTGEFFYSQQTAPGYTTNAYIAEPCFAYYFQTERQAFRFSTFIDKLTEIVPLFDHNDKLIVGFSKKRFIS